MSMLEYDLTVWLDHLRSGNIRAAIPAAARWYTELRRHMEACGLETAPSELCAGQHTRDAILEALKDGKVLLVSHHPATAGVPELWAALIAEVLRASGKYTPDSGTVELWDRWDKGKALFDVEA